MPRIEPAPQAKGFASVYMRHSALWEAFRVHFGTLWEYGSLSPVVRDLVRIRSATLHDCMF